MNNTADTTTDITTRNLDLVTALVMECWDPVSPGAFARFTSEQPLVDTFTAVAQTFPDARLQVAWTVADDRRAAIGGRFHATHLGTWRGVDATGLAIDVACTLSFTIADGVVVDMTSLTDSLALAEQIGVVAPFGPRPCELAREQ